MKDVQSVQKSKIKNKLFNLESASEDEVRRSFYQNHVTLIRFQLTVSLDILIKPITIINLSPESGTFPLSFKEAHMTPLLKKSNLLVNNLKNYRLVSNLSFNSKIIEQVVSNRIQAHINSTN